MGKPQLLKGKQRMVNQWNKTRRNQHSGEGDQYKRLLIQPFLRAWVCEDEEDMTSVFKELQVQWGRGEGISKRRRPTMANATHRKGKWEIESYIWFGL